MSESQFEKMAKANQKLREENERLRGLIQHIHDHPTDVDDSPALWTRIRNEVNDE